MKATNASNYWCSFKIHGGNGRKIRIPYTEIRCIIVDPETLQSKLYLNGRDAAYTISDTPEEIEAQTQHNTI